MNSEHMKSTSALACRGLRKIYLQGKVEVPVLLGVDLTVGKGEHVAIVGASGSRSKLQISSSRLSGASS